MPNEDIDSHELWELEDWANKLVRAISERAFKGDVKKLKDDVWKLRQDVQTIQCDVRAIKKAIGGEWPRP